MAVNAVPWAELRRAYQQGATYEELAQQYGISASTVGRRCRAESWGKRGGGEDGQRAVRIVEQLWESVGEAMDNHTEPWGIKELKELTSLTRELLTLQSLVEPEQEEVSDTLRVVLEGEIEKWSG